MNETKKLYRSCDDKIIAGIAGGLGEYLEIDSTIIRLIFLVLIFSGVGLAAYIVAWILIPENPRCITNKDTKPIKSENKTTFANDDNLRVIFGAIVLGLGILLLFQNIVGEYIWKVFWPSVLVLIGFYLIVKATEK